MGKRLEKNFLKENKRMAKKNKKNYQWLIWYRLFEKGE